MKILDEKGKLFGKINIVDLLALLLVAALLIFLGVRVVLGLTQQSEEPEPEGTRLVYTAAISGVTQEVYQELLHQLDAAGVKDQLMANGKLVDNAYVVDIQAVPHVNYGYDNAGKLVRSEDSGPDARMDLTFTIEAVVPDPTTNLVGTQEVRVGKSHILKTTHFEFSYSTVTTCRWG